MLELRLCTFYSTTTTRLAAGRIIQLVTESASFLIEGQSESIWLPKGGDEKEDIDKGMGRTVWMSWTLSTANKLTTYKGCAWIANNGATNHNGNVVALRSQRHYYGGAILISYSRVSWVFLCRGRIKSAIVILFPPTFSP